MAKNCVRCVLNYMTVPQDGNRCVPKGVSHADINFDTEIQEEVRPLCLVEHCSRPFLPSPEPADITGGSSHLRHPRRPREGHDSNLVPSGPSVVENE